MSRSILHKALAKSVFQAKETKNKGFKTSHFEDVNNFDFSTKKKEYIKTKLAITQRISSLSKIDENFIENRNREILDTIYNDIMI